MIRTDREHKTLETMSLYNTSHDPHMHVPFLLVGPSLRVVGVNEVHSNVIVGECKSKTISGRVRFRQVQLPNDLMVNRSV